MIGKFGKGALVKLSNSNHIGIIVFSPFDDSEVDSLTKDIQEFATVRVHFSTGNHKNWIRIKYLELLCGV